MSWEIEDVQLVPVSWLKPHEEIKPRNRDKLLDMTKRWKGYTKPLLVDSVTGAILDGHHRFSIAIVLGLKRVPAIVLDYLNDENITVSVWPGCGFENLSKEQVIEMSLSNNLFPAKTSKHTISNDVPPIFVLLEQLREDK